VNFLSLIEAKRDGHALTSAQITEIVSAFTAAKIPDYQMAAFLMAVFFRSLDSHEVRALTLAMRDSGEVLKFPHDPRPLVDKHSTGGIGDKVSLPLAPLLACLGFRVPMISGRGLGITGGTLDKMDSIPGFTTLLPTERIGEIVHKVGCVMCGQTARMVPADRGLYALRDVTATVPSIPLIVASILSKKLAEDISALVLDVKFGCAAFMPTLEKARELARALATLSNECGVKTRALLTDMNTPLGRAAGNWLEVKESVVCLSPPIGGGHHEPGLAPAADLRALTVACAAHLLVQTGKAGSIEAALRQAEDCLVSGEPLTKWNEMLAAQGADLAAFGQKLVLDHCAPVVRELKATRSGFVTRCDARIIGEVVRELGGGRLTKESILNYDVGVDHLVKPGEAIHAGHPLLRVHAATRGDAETACARLEQAFAISAEAPDVPPLIVEVIEASS
jgi:pyrimidine-nucleoside phosphorylase